MEESKEDKIALALFEAHNEATAVLREDSALRAHQPTYGQQTFYFIMANKLLKKVDISLKEIAL